MLDRQTSIHAAAPDPESRIVEMDGIRGLACLMVLAHHYVTGVMPKLANPILSTAELIARPFMLSGVDLFFVLSGFLIGGVLIDHRGAPNYFRTFYIRRMCRIFPVYYLLLSLYAVIVLAGLVTTLPPLGIWLFKDPMPFWSYATFTQNFFIAEAGHAGAKWLAITWSLAVEEQFYLLFPLVVFLVRPAAIPWIAGIAIVAAPICRFIALDKLNWFASYTLLPCRMDTLMFGVLVAWLVRQPHLQRVLRDRSAAIKLTLGALMALAAANSFAWVQLGTFMFSLLATIYGLMILIAATDRHSLLARLFRVRFLVFTGAISYAMYMYHQAVNGLLHGFVRHQAPAFADLTDIAITACSVAIVFGLSVLSLRYFERPIRSWGRTFRYEATAEPKAALAAAPR